MDSKDSAQIKKSILMRYPNSFLLELSRELVGYKSYRDNKKVYKAVNIMHTMLEYATVDPATGKRSWEFTTLPEGMIAIPKDLVDAFNAYFIGPRTSGEPSLQDVSPGANMEPMKDIVVIRRPVPLRWAWADRPAEYTALMAGFSYKIQVMTPQGIPTTETVPMVDWNDPEIDTYYTNTIPFALFAEIFDTAWYVGDSNKPPLSLICTRIEKVIAAELFKRGIEESEGEVSTDDGTEFEGEGDFEL